jgi:hypothetical protein
LRKLLEASGEDPTIVDLKAWVERSFLLQNDKIQP